MATDHLAGQAMPFALALLCYMLGWVAGLRAGESLAVSERGVSCQVQDWPMPGEARIGFIRCEGPGEFSGPQLPSE